MGYGGLLLGLLGFPGRDVPDFMKVYPFRLQLWSSSGFVSKRGCVSDACWFGRELFSPRLGLYYGPCKSPCMSSMAFWLTRSTDRSSYSYIYIYLSLSLYPSMLTHLVLFICVSSFMCMCVCVLHTGAARGVLVGPSLRFGCYG